MSVTNFSNGQALSSTALTNAAINTIMQALTTQMLGIAIDAPNFDSAVRLDWPTNGQPAWLITDEICFLRNVVVDNDYNRIRDKVSIFNDGVTVTETWTYTRVWKTSFTVVGPNSDDNARLIKSALFLDFPSDTLAASNLYIIPDIADPMRGPELIQGQWRERAELEVMMNEGVTEVIYTPAVASAEVIILDEFSNIRTITT